MDEEIKEILRGHFTLESPLGPISSDKIEDPLLMKYLFNTENRIYSELANNPSVIVGRKGAGKTAFLRSVKLNKTHQVIAEIKTHEAFSYVVTSIQAVAEDIPFVEGVAEIWETVLWGALFLEITKVVDNNNQEVKVLSKYLKGIGLKTDQGHDDLIKLIVNTLSEKSKSSVGIAATIIKSLTFDDISFPKAKESARNILEKYKFKSVVLMDSLENFALHNTDVAHALSGLLKCIGSFHEENEFSEVRLCLPSELWYTFNDISSNPLKDFKNHIIIHWHAGELLRIAANRLAIYLEIHEEPFYMENEIYKYDLDSREDSLRLFRLITPDTIINGLGKKEQSIAYILRHTQLLPRQLFTYINRIVSKNKRSGGVFTCLSQDAIKDGIYSAEKDITDEIFSAYRYVYPQARVVCEKSIPHLPFVFTVGDLHKVFNRHGKKVSKYDDFDEYMRLLLEIGAIGRVVDTKDRYVVGQFEYTVPHKLVTSTTDSLCIHPSFCQVFSAIYPDKGARVVYPYGSDVGGKDYRDW